MTAPDGPLTKVTVLLTPRSFEALNLAAEYEELSRTDVINWALQLYAAVVTAPAGTAVTLETPVGGRLRLLIPAVPS